METQAKTTTAIDHWLNKLESDHLLESFFHYPPVGFNAAIGENGLPTFSANFDLSTTMDTNDRKRLQALPLYKFWSRFLRYNTLFVGTTVSEFTPIPASLDASAAARFLRDKAKDNYSLVIVKDLPQPSVLVKVDEAEKNQKFFDALQAQGFISVEGQALAYVPVDYSSTDDYLTRFSKARRKDFRRKLRAIDGLKIEVLRSDSPLFQDDEVLKHFYQLYRQVYDQSEIHFDLLSEEFFRNLLQAKDDRLRVIVYSDEQKCVIGYNICFIIEDKLVDKYIGFDYPVATENNLYFISWFYNLEFARICGLKYYVAGWTDPEIKSYLGAQFVYTRHVVFIRNPILRGILKRFRHCFENDANLLIKEGGQS